MIEPTVETLRLSLHVLAATIWVGGQLTLAALVPALRRHDREATRVAAAAFNRVAWPAFGVLVLTGVWNVAEEYDGADDAYRVTLLAKLGVVAASGISALAHVHARTTLERAVGGAATGIFAVLALLLGVLLHG